MAFYEVRQYKIRRGKMTDWLKLMESEIMPFQVSKGMVITGSYRETDESVYIWLRRFNTENERKRLYKAVYEDPHWVNDIAPRVAKLILRDKIIVHRVVPTKKSTAQ
jgi:hypothetical protein